MESRGGVFSPRGAKPGGRKGLDAVDRGADKRSERAGGAEPGLRVAAMLADEILFFSNKRRLAILAILGSPEVTRIPSSQPIRS